MIDGQYIRQIENAVKSVCLMLLAMSYAVSITVVNIPDAKIVLLNAAPEINFVRSDLNEDIILEIYRFDGAMP
jgi:hypothetical protein